LPRGRFDVPHAGENSRQMDMLELAGPPPRKLGVEMLPRPAEGLAALVALLLESLGMGAAGPGEEPLVELVAVAGDARQELGQRHRGVERRRAISADAGGHEDGAGENCGGFEQDFLGGQVVGVGQPLHERIKGHLLDYEAAETAVLVHLVRIPLAEVVIGTLVGRMIEIVGPRIDRQLLELHGVEAGGPQQVFVGGLEQRQRQLHDFALRAIADAGAADVDGDRPDVLVRVGLDLLRFEGGYWPVAEEIIERVERAGDDSFGLP
jgi:hypothetical protein